MLTERASNLSCECTYARPRSCTCLSTPGPNTSHNAWAGSAIDCRKCAQTSEIAAVHKCVRDTRPTPDEDKGTFRAPTHPHPHRALACRVRGRLVGPGRAHVRVRKADRRTRELKTKTPKDDEVVRCPLPLQFTPGPKLNPKSQSHSPKEPLFRIRRWGRGGGPTRSQLSGVGGGGARVGLGCAGRPHRCRHPWLVFAFELARGL